MPLVLTTRRTRRRDDRELGELAPERRVIADQLAEMLNAIGELGGMQEREKRAPHRATRAAGDRIVDLALLGRRALRIDFFQSRHR